MALQIPEPGMVISYAYLWRYEHKQGKEEGRKNRPCVIILAVENKDSEVQVTVAPVTHHAPDSKEDGIEIPLKVKKHLGLDTEHSWVITKEVNQFIWPGYDLRPIPGAKKGNYYYGFLPPKLFDNIKTQIIRHILKKRIPITSRD